ncbi:hypothetical protein Vafri_22307, partial [Volvox africanus]
RGRPPRDAYMTLAPRSGAIAQPAAIQWMRLRDLAQNETPLAASLSAGLSDNGSQITSITTEVLPAANENLAEDVTATTAMTAARIDPPVQQAQRFFCCSSENCPDKKLDTQLNHFVLELQHLHGSRAFPRPIWNGTFCLPSSGNAFALTTLRPVNFRDGCHIVFWCTCDSSSLANRELYDGVDIVPWCYSECNSTIHFCQHARALKVWSSWVNDEGPA